MQNSFKNILEESLKEISLMVFEQSYSSVIITSADVDNPLIIYSNPAFTKQTGYSYEEVIGRNPKILQGKKTDRSVIDRLKKSLQERTFFQGKTVNYKKDGSEYYVEWNISPIFNDNDVLTYFISFQTDITSKVELDQRNEELLIQKEMMIVQSRHAAMGEMIGMIAHQWRQPLTAISTTVMMLSVEQGLDTLNAEKLEKALIKINNYTQNLSKIISDFSNFFKNDKTTNNIKLSQLVEDSLSLIGSILTNHNLRLYREYQCEEEITTYSNEFIQVLLNIFKNAQDVLEDKKIAEPTITIKTYKENDKYCISIEDNAGGIPDTIINKIFEPYFTTKKSLNGIGLGLYMSKIIIHEHCDGTIEAKNTDNGALFIISVNGSVKK